MSGMPEPKRTKITNPVTPEDAEKFEEYIRKWQRLLGLGDWRIRRSLKPPRKGVMAEIKKFDFEQRLVSYQIGMHFGADEVNPETLEATALHEVLHIFLHDLIELSKDELTQPDVLSSAEHRVINVLETLLMKGGH